tara:strand:+ start:568 stop:738 length:171 start_codon:yes stop_codon:yes gene_type:complete
LAKSCHSLSLAPLKPCLFEKLVTEGQSISLRATPKAGGSAEPDMALHLAKAPNQFA